MHPPLCCPHAGHGRRQGRSQQLCVEVPDGCRNGIWSSLRGAFLWHAWLQTLTLDAASLFAQQIDASMMPSRRHRHMYRHARAHAAAACESWIQAGSRAASAGRVCMSKSVLLLSPTASMLSRAAHRSGRSTCRAAGAVRAFVGLQEGRSMRDGCRAAGGGCLDGSSAYQRTKVREEGDVWALVAVRCPECRSWAEALLKWLEEVPCA